MYPAPFKVVLDANVLYPLTLRDTLLRAAAAGYYQVYWSGEILDEALSNLVKDDRMTAEKAARLRAEMSRFFPEAEVDGYEQLIASMPNDEKDRHVAAAAVEAGAQVIVTSNVKDFAQLPVGVEAQSPDTFLCYLYDLDPEGFIELLQDQAEDYQRPPMSWGEVLDILSKTTPEFVSLVREMKSNR